MLAVLWGSPALSQVYIVRTLTNEFLTKICFENFCEPNLIIRVVCSDVILEVFTYCSGAVDLREK